MAEVDRSTSEKGCYRRLQASYIPSANSTFNQTSVTGAQKNSHILC